MVQKSSNLYKEYKRLADRADKRLLRLERLATTQPEKYQGVLSYAYAKAQKSIEAWDGRSSEKPRFARNTPSTDAEMKLKIRDIEAFLEMKTSTKSGIDTVYKKRAESLNKKFGTEFTWQDWVRFGIRGYWDRSDGKFTYNELIKVAKVQKQKQDAIKAYNKMKKHFNRGTGNVKSKETKKYANMLNKELNNMGIKDADIAADIINELGIENLLSNDINLIKKTVNTIFEPNKGIVLKHAEKLMEQNGLTYDTMFK